MSPDDPRHGTRAGCIAHRKAGEKPCDPCRFADNAYMREFRADPETHARVKRENNARARAAWRLVALHREEFERLYLIELGPPLTADDATRRLQRGNHPAGRALRVADEAAWRDLQAALTERDAEHEGGVS